MSNIYCKRCARPSALQICHECQLEIIDDAPLVDEPVHLQPTAKAREILKAENERADYRITAKGRAYLGK